MGTQQKILRVGFEYIIIKFGQHNTSYILTPPQVTCASFAKKKCGPDGDFLIF